MMQRRTLLAGTTVAAAASVWASERGILPRLGDLPNWRYPDPRVEVLDKRFKARIGNGGDRARSPPVSAGRRARSISVTAYLLWSDIPNNRMMRWLEDDGHVSVFRASANYSNGNTRDREGRLITCEHDTRRVTRTELDGTHHRAARRFDGKRLNAPNDVSWLPTGAIWFTDPGYGIDGNYEGHRPRPNCQATSTGSIRRSGHGDRRGR